MTSAPSWVLELRLVDHRLPPEPCWGCGYPLVEHEADLCQWCAPTFEPRHLEVDPSAPDLMTGVRTEHIADLADAILDHHLAELSAVALEQATALGDPAWPTTVQTLARRELGRLLADHRRVVEAERPRRAVARHRMHIRLAQGLPA